MQVIVILKLTNLFSQKRFMIPAHQLFIYSYNCMTIIWLVFLLLKLTFLLYHLNYWATLIHLCWVL